MIFVTADRVPDKLVPTGDITTTSNTASTITGLTFSAEANAVYEVNGAIHCGCNNTGGVKFGVDIPASTTIFLHYFGFNATATDGGISNSVSSDATLTSSAFCAANNANGRLSIRGTITTGATAGTVAFLFASGTNTQTSTIYLEGTVITITRIA